MDIESGRIAPDYPLVKISKNKNYKRRSKLKERRYNYATIIFTESLFSTTYTTLLP